ncbi:hypothetical protein I5H97_gp080 [Mycobacterium phage Wachhund]|uniref:Uncharacterized protein n=2 Tax=Cheoctovirus TaxID=1623281 RepID=A0A515MLG3_9CAUD|nr:hypothetical protein I5H59_gp80 [Mycobacterium phage Mahavrat]YP_009963264.1 hypothetical protein I5H97_gp080 [Mycobacterium phage Wachhund]ASZ74454.1 hypothetical protein SEA_WACHHUND_80 [Mycobacterium phage Wachhund]QDM57464.1 hypothetical protein SEA_MAHAVRAT_80 [Mycobacterium phage Mahavrat]
MSDDAFRASVKAAVDKYGITAVAAKCQTSLLVVRRWAEGFPPYGAAKASVLKAIDSLEEA